MEFRELALPLIEVLYPSLPQGEAVKQLFLDISSFDDETNNGLYDIQPSTYRGYLLPGHGISKPAGLVVGNLDKEKFASKVYALSEGAIDRLLDALGGDIPEMNSVNVGDAIADALSGVIAANSRKRRNRSSGLPPGSSDIEPELFLETGGRCPLCGKAIGAQPAGKKGGYRIVSIIPLEARKDYRSAKKYEEIVPQLPALGSPESRIALCFDCASDYENSPSVEKFKKVIDKKKAMHAQEELMAEVSSLDLEKELPMLLAKLGEAGSFEELAQLSMEAVRVDDKISIDYPLLRSKVTVMAITYYKFIEEQGRLLEAQGALDFKKLATQVRLCYLALRKLRFDQEEIFERICDWAVEKTGSKTRGACEVLTAFFVQNCEVFDALSK